MEESKKSSKGLIVLVVILILIILGLAGYICYDKFIDEDIKPSKPEAQEVKQKYNGYEVFAREGKDEEILTVNINDKWYVAGNSNNQKNVIGEFNGELYFFENVRGEKRYDAKLKSINIQTKEEKDYWQATDCYIVSGFINNNKLYFTAGDGLLTVGQDKEIVFRGKIFSIDLSSTNPNERVEILDTKVTHYSQPLEVIKADDENLYYAICGEGNGNTCEVKKMNFESKKITSIKQVQHAFLVNNELMLSSVVFNNNDYYSGRLLERYNEVDGKIETIKKFDNELVGSSFLKKGNDSYSYYYVNKDYNLVKYQDSKEEILYKNLKKFNPFDNEEDFLPNVSNVYKGDIVNIDNLVIIKNGEAYTNEKDIDKMIPEITAITATGEELVLSYNDLSIIH